MKIGFYSPYIDTLGGGERYMLTLASHWSREHNVSVFWDDPMVLRQAQERFDLDVSHVHVVPNIFSHDPLISKLFLTSQYDLIFFLSDGSIPTSCATHNFLHFQVPFQHVSFPFWKKMHLRSIICNSEFTKHAIDPSVGKNACVIYPPVDIEKFTFGKKEKIILSVGRFSSFFQAKKQEILIDIFSNGVKQGILKDWKLVLAGGLLPSDKHYVETLKLKIESLPITLIPNISFENLKAVYSTSLIYWHAAGFGETDPTRMEHFGITTVEAMASGCIPVVYNAGGQPEIVKHEKNGYLWKTPEECLNYTEDIIRSKRLQQELQKVGRETIKEFSVACFCGRFDKILEEIA